MELNSKTAVFSEILVPHLPDLSKEEGMNTLAGQTVSLATMVGT